LGAPFGVKGFIKAYSFSGEYEHLLALKKAVLRAEQGEFSLEIEETAPIFQGMVVKFRGIDSPEDAQPLRGAEIVVSREQAAPLADGEFYIEDLKGVNVELDGKVIGEINDLVEGGGGFLVEIQLLNGETRLVPFRDEFFGEIDTVSNRAKLFTGWILE
jgi:16S rRNA processing protein RimM